MVMTNKYSLSQESVMAKAQDLLKEIRIGVGKLLESQAWQDQLKFSATFHEYSFSNTFLIYLQNREATRVAGFQAWKKLGRWVKKGEKGISIVVPCFSSIKQEEELKADETKDRGSIYFMVRTVFDVSQTAGKEIPDISKVYRLLNTETPEGLFNDLREYAEGLGLPVSFEKLPELQGGYSDGKKIVLNETLPPAHKIKTLLHEISHNILQHLTERKKESRQDCELEAESCAYLTANALGLDTSDTSFAYLTFWGGLDAEKKLLKIGTTAMKGSQAILKALGKEKLLENAA